MGRLEGPMAAVMAVVGGVARLFLLLCSGPGKSTQRKARSVTPRRVLFGGASTVEREPFPRIADASRRAVQGARMDYRVWDS